MKVLLLITLAAYTVAAQQRLPFEKQPLTFKSPTTSERRVRRDPKTGQMVSYDSKPQIMPLSPKLGKYNLTWIGQDGRPKATTYQRPDALDAAVAASASQHSGRYRYKYTVLILPPSGQHLQSFALQTFTHDAKITQKDANVFFGAMSNNAIMVDGNWVRFALMAEIRPKVLADRKIELELVSTAPPGLVECRIQGGDQTIVAPYKDAPPEELLDMIPGYEAWPKSYTIGPVSRLQALSTSQRAEYLLNILPRLRQQRWMTASSFRLYKQSLQSGDLEQILKRADQDLKSGGITTEVHSIIQAMQP